MSGWPSGLRRQTQGWCLVAMGFLVHECGCGFESHFWQRSILLSLRKNNYVCRWFSVKFCIFNQKIFKSNRDIYYLCESIYWKVGVILCFPLIFLELWMSGWPSGLRRPTQGPYVFVMGVLVHECGRGFESHFWQNSILLSLRKNNYVWCWFSVKFWLYIKKILKSSLDIYNLCESIYWTSWSYSVFFIISCSTTYVRMAERSKAPDSRAVFSCNGFSGPWIWAWVRIPLLTK